MATKLIVGINDLRTINPELSAQWHPIKNNNLTPEMFTSGSSKKVWWKGPCGHEWEATIASRNSGAGCRFCAKENLSKRIHQSALLKAGSLQDQNPSLATEWHSIKNGSLTPKMVTPNSHKIVWWIGSCQHEWVASIKARNNGTGCPYCAGTKVLAGYNDLETLRPDIASEWNHELNSTLLPSMVTSNSNTEVWWKCSFGHEWLDSVKKRSKGAPCPQCNANRLAKKSLSVSFPLIAKEWHPTKNGDMTPESTLAGSHTIVWWMCANGHEWPASPNHRTSKTRGCQYCRHNPSVLKGTNDLLTVHPELEKEWDYEKNGGKTPSDFTANSSKKVWWKCARGHSWRTAINHRANGSGCSACASGKQTSFPEQAIFFYVKRAYPDALNGYTDVFANHGMELDIFVPSLSLGIEYDGLAYHKTENQRARESQKYKICKQYGISLIRIREDLNYKDSSTCDILLFVKTTLDETIIQLKKYLTKIEDISLSRDEPIILQSYLNSQFDSSLKAKNSVLAEEWNYKRNGKLTPDTVAANSNHTVWWICSLGHEWNASIDSRVRGRKCPYCSNRKVLSGFNDLATKRPDLASEWNFDKNTELGPTAVLPGSGKKVWWKCSSGHEWPAEISSRNKGAGCPTCYKLSRKRHSQQKPDP